MSIIPMNNVNIRVKYAPKGNKGDDGYTPIKGVDYFDGEDGHTPIKGVDYFDGEKGDKGDNGDIGESGVYIGAEAPTDPEAKVWIDTSGGVSTVSASGVMVEDLDGHFTSDPKNSESVLAEIGTELSEIDQTISGIGQSISEIGESILTINQALDGMGGEEGASTLLHTHTYSGNNNVIVTSVDINTDTFTYTSDSPIVINNLLFSLLNVGQELIYLPNVICGGMTNVLYYARNVTPTTFQIATTASDTTIVNLTTAGDVTKWHFEIPPASTSLVVTGLPSVKRLLIRVRGRILTKGSQGQLLFNSIGNTSEWLRGVLAGTTNNIIISGGNSGYYVDWIIDSRGALTCHQRGVMINPNNGAGNTSSFVNEMSVAPKYAGLEITGITVGVAFANGTILEVWSA
jgi:hypothetical protein